jgi:hypothetical protein
MASRAATIWLFADEYQMVAPPPPDPFCKARPQGEP